MSGLSHNLLTYFTGDGDEKAKTLKSKIEQEKFLQDETVKQYRSFIAAHLDNIIK